MRRISLEASSIELLDYFFWKGTCPKDMELLPAKYQFLVEASHNRQEDEPEYKTRSKPRIDVALARLIKIPARAYN
jgi:hypothetical protein